MLITMVFGFGEGKIKLEIPKSNFAYGETIKGRLKLELKKPKQARQLRVTIKAEQKRMSRHAGKTRYETHTLYKFDVMLDGEKTYNPPGAEHDFSIQVPQKNVIPAKPEGTLGTALNAAEFLMGSHTQTKWILEGVLDIPKGIDIRKSVQISVG